MARANKRRRGKSNTNGALPRMRTTNWRQCAVERDEDRTFYQRMIDALAMVKKK
jgi:hypothetical protein